MYLSFSIQYRKCFTEILYHWVMTLALQCKLLQVFNHIINDVTTEVYFNLSKAFCFSKIAGLCLTRAKNPTL